MKIINDLDSCNHISHGFEFLYLPDLYQDKSNDDSKNDYLMIFGAIMDFLRLVTLHKGKVLFVEKGNLLDSTSSKSLVGEYIILWLSHIESLPAYEVYTAIRSRNPIFDICHDNLRLISKWCSKQLEIQNYLKGFPTLECMWGSWVIIMKRQFADHSNMHTITSNSISKYLIIFQISNSIFRYGQSKFHEKSMRHKEIW